MQQHRHPDVLRLHVGPAKKHRHDHAGDDLAGKALQAGLGRIVEEVERQVPRGPDQPQRQHAAARPEALLQARLQVVTPAVFLAKKRQEREEKVRDQQQKRKIRGGRGPVGEVFAQLAIGQHAEENRRRAQQNEQRHKPQRLDAAVPAQPGGGALFFAFGQQKDPGQRAARHNDQVRRRQPDIAGGQHRAQAAGDERRRIEQVKDKEAPGQRRAAGGQVGQHDARGRVVHLCVGENVGVIAAALGDGQRQAHQKGQAVGNEQKDEPLLFRLRGAVLFVHAGSPFLCL